MKKFLLLIAAVFAFTQLSAQTNEPVRLALISETDPAATAADVLTAQFSSNQKIQLLERDQIAKVYREQGLSAGNRDYLKLGQILGADGLLALQTTTEGTNQFLNVRLIAVKPGVVLVAEKFIWPITNLTEWASPFSGHLDVFLPKLTVLIKDAIPLSVVNLRSAVNSSEAGGTEQQLKVLTIQRLSREPQLFVLERQKMQLLTEEKELKTDDTAFWNGSYLLEGVVDQNGYSKETITINARLTPPKGGAPLQFEVSGSRTNLAEVINQLAAKVNEALKVNSTVKEWNAADEAAKYFDEAKWALRWRVYSEAQAAADSAWALGKQDMDCAIIRITAYMSEVLADAGEFQPGEATYGEGFNDAYALSNMKEMSAQHPYGLIYKIQHVGDAKVVNYVFVSGSPDSKNIDRALHALELYYDFSRTSPDGEPKILTRGKGWNDWHNSDWYLLGIDDLIAASRVLQNFNFVPESQKPVADKLAELRASARSVAGLISKSPTVHDSYYVGDRVVTHDELVHTIGENGERNPNLFSCEVKWGCFWQETPEDCVALYRDLMSSPVFCYIHDKFWFRDLQTPRLAAWNETDRQRIPMVWNGFVRELVDSSNVLSQLEAKALALADADSDKNMAVACTNLFGAIFENHDALVNNNVEVLYLDWGTGSLIDEKAGSGVVSATKDALHRLYYSEYRPKLEAMDREYWFLPTFERQIQFLKENKPDDIQKFSIIFLGGFENYSKAQALEIQPLLAAYKSNLVAQANEPPNANSGMIRFTVMQVGRAEANVNRTLNPPPPNPQQSVQTPAPNPAIPATTAAVPPVSNHPAKVPASERPSEIVTNVLTVNKFLAIPLDSLRRDEPYNVTITANHWLEGKLLLDVQYGNDYEQAFNAIAILDPKTEHWDVMDCPDVNIPEENHFYHRTTLCHGELFNCDGGKIRQYDFQKQQWQVLPISDGNNCELFAVNGHLYAANGTIIFEITDGGKATSILASTRRQPPVSILDTQSLGTPTLFEGPNHSLRVLTQGKILTWAGNDWHEDFAAPSTSLPPGISSGGTLIRTDGFNPPVRIFYLATESHSVEFCLGEKTMNNNFARRGANTSDSSEPLWKLPPGLPLANLPAAWDKANLYLLVDNSQAQEIIDEQQHLIVGKKMVAKDGYHTALLFFSNSFQLPQKLFLKFEAVDGCPPVTGLDPNSRQMFPGMSGGSRQMFQWMPPAWMLFGADYLFFGLSTPQNADPAISPVKGTGYKAGVWIMPISQLDSAIAVQKQISSDTGIVPNGTPQGATQ